VTMPNFLIIGAQKAGTTSLANYLDQHPDVYMSPVKEPNFFALEEPGASAGRQSPVNSYEISSIEAYRKLFRGVTTETAVGEASPWYLYSPVAPERIKRYVPEARLIAILRDPAERAYSQYLHFLRDGIETEPDFLSALRAEAARLRDGAAADAAERDAAGAYLGRGFYHAQLRRYLELFDRERVMICFSEDLSRDPERLLRDVFRFLGVDDSFVPAASTRHNAAGVPRSKLLHAFLTGRHPVRRAVRSLKPYMPPEARQRLAGTLAHVRQRNFATPPPLPPEARRFLVEAYREDVLRLQDLVGRDLSGWLAAPAEGSESLPVSRAAG